MFQAQSSTERHPESSGSMPAISVGHEHSQGRRGSRGGRGGRGGKWRGRGGRNSPSGVQPHPTGGQERNGLGAEVETKEMRYGQLKGLAEDDGVRILQKLSSPELQDMFNRLTCESDLDGDRMCLVVRVLAKLCVVEYQPLVASLFCRVCRQEFLNRLLLHIVQLSVLTDDTAATADFYRDFCRLCHGIVKLIPTLAWDKLDNMVRKAASELTQLPPFEGATEIGKDLDLIRAKLAVERERLSKDPQPPSSRSRWRTGGKQSAHHKFRFDDLTPPDDFRMISVYPTVEDISEPGQPYLRRALPRGPYRDANHYLDVHFRLLREDFVRPLREGIVEYCKKMAEMPPDSKKRPRIQNLRIYENVCFNSLLSDDEHVALEVGFDPEGNGLARVNWEYSRRLIRGALLVFARDLSFTSIVLATVSKRDVAQLNEGRLTVELCEPGVGEDLFTGTYVMVECINFYGAYLHPMRALQALDEASVPLREYLVEGSSARVVPHYLMAAALQGSGLKLPAGDAEGAPPALLQDPSLLAEWPSAATLGLDESQHRALQGALTNKVMLVQGPPGTGKTTVEGEKVAARGFCSWVQNLDRLGD